MSELLTTAEVASVLRLSVATLEAWRARGDNTLPFVRLGRRAIRYRREDVEAFAGGEGSGSPDAGTGAGVARAAAGR